MLVTALPILIVRLCFFLPQGISQVHYNLQEFMPNYSPFLFILSFSIYHQPWPPGQKSGTKAKHTGKYLTSLKIIWKQIRNPTLLCHKSSAVGMATNIWIIIRCIIFWYIGTEILYLHYQLYPCRAAKLMREKPNNVNKKVQGMADSS